MIPVIQNIMSVADLGCHLDLPYIATHCCNTQYRPKVFNPVVMKISEPKSTALIFASGKIVCTGTKNENDSRLAAKKFYQTIKELGFPVKFLNYRITNIAASCQVDFPVNFYKIYKEHTKFVDYNPEIFPALIYRKDVTILLFKSGKVIVTNVKTRQQLYDSYKEFEKAINSSPN